MKVIITQEQFNLLKETKKESASCSKCDHSWEIEKKDEHPHLCHICGYDAKSKKHNYEELENFWKNYKKEEVTEKWSEKYKKSINCNSPKGFSQKAHCQGRKKHLKENFENPEIFKSSIEKNLKEYTSNYEWLDSVDAEFTTLGRSGGWIEQQDVPMCMYTVKFNGNKTPSYEQQSSLFDDISFVHSMFFPVEDGKPTCYFSTKSEYPSGDIKSFPSLRTMSENKEESKLIEGKYDLDKIKKALKILSQISASFGEYIPLDFKLYGYEFKRSVNLKVMVLYIDVDSKDGVYDPPSGILYEISQQLLEIFQMMGIRDERRIYPLYDFKFNKRSLEGITII
jgi:hypothetical protein